MRASPRLVIESPKHVRSAGFAITIGMLSEQMWWTKTFLGLRCDLTRLPRVRKARVPVTMEPTSTSLFRGFDTEIAQSRGTNYVELLFRRGLCDSGVQELYVAYSDGKPAYAQWLTREDDQDRLHEHSPGRYDPLESDEVLLEGAFTFAEFRRMGVMADGMSQLLHIAKEEGASSAITYVPINNLPSLRGCSNVGFDLDHVRVSVRRFGRRRGFAHEPDEAAEMAWAEATAR
jgi:GNAT superfamily N-acetyltransferase